MKINNSIYVFIFCLAILVFIYSLPEKQKEPVCRDYTTIIEDTNIYFFETDTSYIFPALRFHVVAGNDETVTVYIKTLNYSD